MRAFLAGPSMCAQSQGLFLCALSPWHKGDFLKKEPAVS